MMRRSDNIVPELCVHDGRAALEFYKQAFGAVEQEQMMSPDGAKLLHGALTIGEHRLVVFDEFSSSEGGTCRCPQTLGGTGVRLILDVNEQLEELSAADEAKAAEQYFRQAQSSSR
jgi:PhnB protein